MDFTVILSGAVIIGTIVVLIAIIAHMRSKKREEEARYTSNKIERARTSRGFIAENRATHRTNRHNDDDVVTNVMIGTMLASNDSEAEDTIVEEIVDDYVAPVVEPVVDYSPRAEVTMERDTSISFSSDSSSSFSSDSSSSFSSSSSSFSSDSGGSFGGCD